MSQKHKIPFPKIPVEGKHLEVFDQAIWQKPLQEFQIDCQIKQDLAAKIFLLPTEDGCLIQGTLHGQVILPCKRCAEDTLINLECNFEEFEEIPTTSDTENPAEESCIKLEQGLPVLDLGALCWEEFLLALPANPLCQPDCKGICPVCGINLNTGICQCKKEEGDPRMSIFRTLKIPIR